MRRIQQTTTSRTFDRPSANTTRIAAAAARSSLRHGYTAREHDMAMDRLLVDLALDAVSEEPPAEPVREPKPYRGLRLVGTTRCLETKPAVTTR